MGNCKRCHRQRKLVGNGLCKHCFQTEWRRERNRVKWERLRRPCALCGTVYTPAREASTFCSPDCQVLSGEFDRAERRTPGFEERYATRDREKAALIAETARGRGCVKVAPKTAGIFVGRPYYSAWHRGGGLYVVRVRWPAVEREEDNEEEVEAEESAA